MKRRSMSIKSLGFFLTFHSSRSVGATCRVRANKKEKYDIIIEREKSEQKENLNNENDFLS